MKKIIDFVKNKIIDPKINNHLTTFVTFSFVFITINILHYLIFKSDIIDIISNKEKFIKVNLIISLIIGGFFALFIATWIIDFVKNKIIDPIKNNPLTTFVIFSFVLTIILIFFSLKFKSEITKFIENDEGMIEAYRNISLIIAGIVASFIATWRSITADKQQKISEEGLQNDRFQTAAKMFASEIERERIAAIYALRDLVITNPKKYYITILDIFCSYLREPWFKEACIKGEYDEALKAFEANDEEKSKIINKEITYPSFPSDRQLICEVVFATLRDFKTYREHKKIEDKIKWKPFLEKAELLNLREPANTSLPYFNFSNINANYALFDHATLQHAHFDYADLYKAHFDHANLDNAHFNNAFVLHAHFDNVGLYRARFDNAFLRVAHFDHANLDNAHFDYAVLKEAHFNNANLEQAHFDKAKDLKPEQLQNAFVWGDCPESELPKLPDDWNKTVRELILFCDPSFWDQYSFSWLNDKIPKWQPDANNCKKWHEWPEDVRKKWLEED